MSIIEILYTFVFSYAIFHLISPKSLQLNEDTPGREEDIWRNAEGQLHREDGPAVTYTNGREEWWQNGKLHRVDGPAIIYADGGEAWHLNGKLHLVDGPAVTYANGEEAWYLNGELHRVDGPAVTYADGEEAWWQNGKKITPVAYRDFSRLFQVDGT